MLVLVLYASSEAAAKEVIAVAARLAFCVPLEKYRASYREARPVRLERLRLTTLPTSDKSALQKGRMAHAQDSSAQPLRGHLLSLRSRAPAGNFLQGACDEWLMGRKAIWATTECMM